MEVHGTNLIVVQKFIDFFLKNDFRNFKNTILSLKAKSNHKYTNPTKRNKTLESQTCHLRKKFPNTRTPRRSEEKKKNHSTLLLLCNSPFFSLHLARKVEPAVVKYFRSARAPSDKSLFFQPSNLEEDKIFTKPGLRDTAAGRVFGYCRTGAAAAAFGGWIFRVNIVLAPRPVGLCFCFSLCDELAV